VTITHPYGYPFAIFMICGALFFLAGAWAYIDDIAERRRQRHLDEITKATQKLELVRESINDGRIPGQRSS
jgi:hypothetical protein